MSISLKERFEDAPWRLVSGYHDATLLSLSIELRARNLRISLEAIPDSDIDAPAIKVDYSFIGVERFQLANGAAEGALDFSNYIFPYSPITDSFECFDSHEEGCANFVLTGIFERERTLSSTSTVNQYRREARSSSAEDSIPPAVGSCA